MVGAIFGRPSTYLASFSDEQSSPYARLKFIFPSLTGRCENVSPLQKTAGAGPRPTTYSRAVTCSTNRLGVTPVTFLKELQKEGESINPQERAISPTE